MQTNPETGCLLRSQPSTQPNVRWVILRAEIAGLRPLLQSLRSELGLLRTAAVIRDVIGQQLRGAPWAGMPGARDERERLSRRQLGTLVTLHVALIPRVGREHSTRILRALSLEAGKTFLAGMLPTSAEGFPAQVPALLARFFNAEGDIRVYEDSVAFDVRRCLFVELLDTLGYPELKPIFCAVDEAFFALDVVPIQLRRTTTLATGGSCCDFRLRASD